MERLEIKGKAATAIAYAKVIEDEAVEQIRRMCDYEFAEGAKIRIMPDVHWGKGCTIGTTMTVTDKVVPNLVGVDIGCGMYTVNLGKKELDLAKVDEAAHIIPSGRQLWEGRQAKFDFTELRCYRELKNVKRIAKSLGTLGGGNHFIELCADTTETIWLTLHSGSRNIGKEIAHRHIGRAKTLDWNRHGPNHNLPVILRKNATGAEQTEWADYLHDLTWAQDYAALNRTIMMATIKTALHNLLPQVCYTTEINCHHNYVAIEHHDGTELAITRKGAISATRGEWGIIPGSMGTGAAIVRGLGNPAAYCSASHGAGRIMSRSEARRSFTLDDLAHQTAGVECRKDPGVLDEIPGAYKNLDQVLAYEQDLVTVETKLTTLLCVKG